MMFYMFCVATPSIWFLLSSLSHWQQTFVSVWKVCKVWRPELNQCSQPDSPTQIVALEWRENTYTVWWSFDCIITLQASRGGGGGGGRVVPGKARHYTKNLYLYNMSVTGTTLESHFDTNGASWWKFCILFLNRHSLVVILKISKQPPGIPGC